MWLWFDAKMALAALIALIHDILVTLGIYSLSGFQVSPDTVIAFLTILGYSLYDTIVVFDRVQENTRGLASTNRLTYSDTVNLSMNQVLARSINTSLVAILPILSILVIGAWVLGATALQDFGLALFVGLDDRRLLVDLYRLPSAGVAQGTRAPLRRDPPPVGDIGLGRSKRITPAAAATGDLSGALPVAAAAASARRPGRAAVPGRSGPPRPADGSGVVTQDRADGPRAPRPGGPTTGAAGHRAERAEPRTADHGGRGTSPPSPVNAPHPVKSRNRLKSRNPLNRALPARRRLRACPPPTGSRLAGPAVPPRAGNRPPPRPRKKGRRR